MRFLNFFEIFWNFWIFLNFLNFFFNFLIFFQFSDFFSTLTTLTTQVKISSKSVRNQFKISSKLVQNQFKISSKQFYSIPFYGGWSLLNEVLLVFISLSIRSKIFTRIKLLRTTKSNQLWPLAWIWGRFFASNYRKEMTIKKNYLINFSIRKSACLWIISCNYWSHKGPSL